MHIISKTVTSLALAAMLSAGAAAPAMAKHDGNRDIQTATVSYGDLNLASEAGAQKLESRIRYAARKVCGPQANRSITAMTDYRTCYKSALTSGKKAMVTLIAQAKSGDVFAKNAALSVGQ